MKKGYIILLGILLSSYQPISMKNYVNHTFYNKEKVQLIHLDVEPKIEIKRPKYKNLDLFLNDLGFKESSNRYNIVNKFEYLGKYQFSKATIKGLGYKITQKQFLSSPELQEEIMLELLKHNRKKLKKYIEKYNNKKVHGILVTESGILAACHLGGIKNVKKWFKYKSNPKDGFNTSLTDYMELFSGYNLNLN